MKLVDYNSDSEEDWSQCPQEFFEEEVEDLSLSLQCGSKRKIMSAELALQREVAYVMKVARLQSQHCKDEGIHSAFAQAPYSNQIVPVDHVKFQTENPSRESAALQRQFHTEQNLQIHPSDSVPCPPPLRLKQTYTERSPVNWPQLQNPFLKQTPEKQQMLCTRAFDLKQQYRGKNHIAKFEELNKQTDGKNTRTKSMKPLWCDLCKVLCMNEHCFQEHLKGKKHAACVEAIKWCNAS